MWTRCFLSLSLLANAALLSVSGASSSNECVYTLYVQTGSVKKAGTHSNISIALGDSDGKSVRIQNLKDWGVMGREHEYFERRNPDIFTGRGPCIRPPICRLSVTTDRYGPHLGWFCEYVQVTSTGPHKGCSQSIFYVDQWLASDIDPPYRLSAVIDGCRDKAHFGSRPYAVRKAVRHVLV